MREGVGLCPHQSITPRVPWDVHGALTGAAVRIPCVPLLSVPLVPLRVLCIRGL